MMPVLDGTGMLQAMWAVKAQRDIPCIVVSSAPEADVRGRIEDCAVFVCKPFEVGLSKNTVAGIVKRARAPFARS